MIKNKVKIIIIIIAMVIISGFFGYTYYADVNAIRNTKVTITDIILQELQLTYCKLKLFININNLADRDISDISAKFDVNIANNYVGFGSFSKISVPSKSVREIEATLTIYYLDVASAVVEVIKNGKFDVTVEGEINASVLLNLISVSQGFKASHTYT